MAERIARENVCARNIDVAEITTAKHLSVKNAYRDVYERKAIEDV